MSIFAKKKELPPDLGRPDFVNAISGAEGDEMRHLRFGQNEITYLEDYFDEYVPDEEPVLAVASCCYPTSLRVSYGAILTTEKPIMAAVGTYRNGRLVGHQDVYEFPMAHVAVLTQPWVGGFIGTFQLTRQSPIQLQVGRDMDWARMFFNTVNRQITATL